MPQILNRKTHGLPRDAVYVGRPSKWGNPFEIGKDGNRAEVIEKYRQWLLGNQQLLRQVKAQLRGKDLACWCHPLPCHAEVLLQIANPDLPENPSDRIPF